MNNERILKSMTDKSIDVPFQREDDDESYIKRINEKVDSLMTDTITIHEALSESVSDTLCDLIKSHHKVGGKESFIANEVMKLVNDYLYVIAKDSVDEESE